MTIDYISSEAAQEKSIDQLCNELSTSPAGLTNEEAQNRLKQFGLNALEEKKVNPFIKFLGYFWGPIPWMIEIAAVLSAIVRHWDDLVIILLLLIPRWE